MVSPLQQFEIKYFWGFCIGRWNLGITNSTLSMILALLGISFFLYCGMRHAQVVPSPWQAAVEILYFRVKSLFEDNVAKSGEKFFPLVLTIFLFTLAVNVFGLLPYAFTVTSHIIITFAMACFVIGLITVIGFCRHGLHFFSILLPSGTPWWMMPFMIIIELFAYFSRVISLSVRLAANMTIGHTMLKVIAGFAVGVSIFQAAIPFLFTTLLIGFELFIAVLQAYIFTILTCVYLNSVLELDH